MLRDQLQKNNEQLIEKIIGRPNMRNLFEIFVQPEANQIQSHLMIIVVVVVAKGHMEMEVVADMGAHMEMIMVLNQVIVQNLQMVMGRINIIHIIIITTVTMIGTDKRF